MRHLLLFRILAAVVVFLSGSTYPALASVDATGSSGADSVPMYRGGPDRTGANPGPGPAGTPVVRWQTRLDTMLNASPVIADGVVYVGSASPLGPGGSLHAVSAKTGDELWRLSTEPGDGIFTTAAVVDGVVYAGSYYGTVIAADAVTGRERWRFTADAAIYSSPAVVAGVVYVGDNAGTLYALDAATGDPRWRFAPDEPWERYVNGSPAVVDGTVYVVSGVRRPGKTSWLHALDAATGHERWHVAGHAGDDLYGTPAVATGVVYVSSLAGILYAVDAGDGHARWQFAPGAASMTYPAVVDGVVYLGTDRDLHALDATSGRERWSHALSRSAAVGTSPTVADGVVYAADANGWEYAIGAATGDERWHLDLGGPITSAAIVDGVVFVGTTDGSLVALGDPEHEPSPLALDVRAGGRVLKPMGSRVRHPIPDNAAEP
jgi:outer membrane protein assembly factor BamB